MQTNNKKFYLCLIALIVFIGAFNILTIREGHDWGDDFSMYINHARNITEEISAKQNTTLL